MTNGITVFYLLTNHSKGQELDRMKGIVGKTGGEVRIMDGENIPGNLDKERDIMEILSAEIEQEEEEEEEKPGMVDDKIHEKQEPTVKTKNKPSRNRSKKKNENNQKSQEEEDKLTLKSYVDFLKTEPSQNRITYDEAMEIAQKMAKNEPFDKIDIHESPMPSEATLENVGKAIKRLAKSRENDFNSRLETVQAKTKDMNIDEMLELLGQGSYSSMKEDELVTAPPEPEIEIIPVSNPDPPPVPVVEVKDDFSDSDSSSSSSSDSESDSDSDSETDSDSDSSEGEVASSHHIPSVPSAPSAAWYRQWYQAVQQQRQALQNREYYAYLQHMGYYSQ